MYCTHHIRLKTVTVGYSISQHTDTAQHGTAQHLLGKGRLAGAGGRIIPVDVAEGEG
jgi:hypothetical protein